MRLGRHASGKEFSKTLGSFDEAPSRAADLLTCSHPVRTATIQAKIPPLPFDSESAVLSAPNTLYRVQFSIGQV